MAPHFSRLFGFFHSNQDGRVITRQNMTYCAVSLAVFGSLIIFSPAAHAVGQEVDRTYRGRQVDDVFFGLDHSASSQAHKEILIGEMQRTTFSLKAPHHEVSWDFSVLNGGMHVLSIDCIILSEERAATPSYMNFSGDWVVLPRMAFRSPWYDHNLRYYLIDLPPGQTRFKVKFSGTFPNMFYIRSARLYRIADTIEDHDPPVVIDYIAAASAATSWDIHWISNEPSSVEILYGRQIDQFEDSVSNDRFTEDQVITLSELAPGTRYYYQIDLTDAAGNRSSYGPYDFTTEEFPFQIYNVRFNGLADSSATILWETDIASAGQLHYGTTPALAHSFQDSGFATDHYIRLEDLLPDTVYYFKIEANDETGNIAYADNHGAYYRFKTSALNQTALVVEIDGDGIDNDGDGFSDRNDPDGYLAVDSNIGTPDRVSDFIGSLEDKVDFGFRHWSAAAGDPIDDDTDIDDSMGAHNATNIGGRILEVSIFGGTTEWDFNVSQPGFYILSLFGWWRDTRAYYFDSNQWQQLPQPSGHSAQYYLIRLSQPVARFKLENGYHFHAQIFQVGSDPFSGAVLNPVHPRLYFKAQDIERLKDRIEDVAVLGNPTDSYRHFLLNGWGSASFYQAADFSAWQNLVDPRTFANGLSYLGLAYILTDNTDFADKLIEMMLLAARWDSGWGRDRSVLKNGEMLAGMAIAYDLVYNYMTPYKRDIIRRALDRECRYLWVKSLNAEHYGDGEYWWASEKSNNWAAVAHGGLGAAALALLNESKYARAYVDQAVKISKRFMDTNFDADGVYQESFMYYEYALEYLMIFVDALKNVTGTDLYHYNNDVIQKSTIWHLYGVEPSKASLTPFDNDTENGFVASPYLLAVASAYNDSLIMWHWNNIAGQHRNRAVHQSLNLGGTTHLVPLVLLWYDDTVAQTSPGGRLTLGAVWPDFGRAVSLTGFESSDDIHFALQSGVGGFHGNHQDQGSFFLNAYGERLVGEGGVYNFEDSKYHNIIMIDDMGQGTPDLDQPNRAGIAGFLHADLVDYIEADTTHAYAYDQANPVQNATRQILFVRPTDSSAAYFVLLDQIEKGDGRPHNYEFLLHSTKSNPIESIAGNRFRIDGIQADLEIFFAQPASVFSRIETEHDVPVLKAAAATEQFDGLFFTLLFPTNSQHGLPEIRAIEASQASVMNVGEDTVVFNKTGSSMTYQNLKTDGQIAIFRENQNLDLAAVFKATELTHNHINYVRTDNITNIVFEISEDGYHLTIGNESIEKRNSAATVTLGGLIPRGTYCLTDNGIEQGCFIASENGFYALDTTLDRKHVYKIDYIAH